MAEKVFPDLSTVLLPVSFVLSFAPPLTVNEVLTSVFPRDPDLAPPLTSVPPVSAEVPMTSSLPVYEAGSLEVKSDSQLFLDAYEEPHEGEADPPAKEQSG